MDRIWDITYWFLLCPISHIHPHSYTHTQFQNCYTNTKVHINKFLIGLRVKGTVR